MQVCKLGNGMCSGEADGTWDGLLSATEAGESIIFTSSSTSADGEKRKSRRRCRPGAIHGGPASVYVPLEYRTKQRFLFFPRKECRVPQKAPLGSVNVRTPTVLSAPPCLWISRGANGIVSLAIRLPLSNFPAYLHRSDRGESGRPTTFRPFTTICLRCSLLSLSAALFHQGERRSPSSSPLRSRRPSKPQPPAARAP